MKLVFKNAVFQYYPGNDLS